MWCDFWLCELLMFCLHGCKRCILSSRLRSFIFSMRFDLNLFSDASFALTFQICGVIFGCVSLCIFLMSCLCSVSIGASDDDINGGRMMVERKNEEEYKKWLWWGQ